MLCQSSPIVALLLLVSTVSAQYADSEQWSGGGGGGGGSHHYFPTYYHKVVVAHAVLASVSWVIFFPLGAVLMRLLSGPNTIWVHAGIQISSTAIFTAAVVMGIWMARWTHQLNSYHPIIGLVIFAVIWFQIVAALVHHFVLYPKCQRRSSLAVVHIWLGRILVTLGMINGGLGLKLSDDATRGEYIAYGVVSGIIWLGYVCLITWFEIKTPEKRSESPSERSERRSDLEEKGTFYRGSEAGSRRWTSHEMIRTALGRRYTIRSRA